MTEKYEVRSDIIMAKFSHSRAIPRGYTSTRQYIGIQASAWICLNA